MILNNFCWSNIIYYNNKLALVQVMAWCWTGDKPLPALMLTQTMIPCSVTRPQIWCHLCLIFFHNYIYNFPSFIKQHIITANSLKKTKTWKSWISYASHVCKDFRMIRWQQMFIQRSLCTLLKAFTSHHHCQLPFKISTSSSPGIHLQKTQFTPQKCI